MSCPFYKQPDSVDCGPICLHIVSKHYGRNILLQSLREKAQLQTEEHTYSPETTIDRCRHDVTEDCPTTHGDEKEFMSEIVGILEH